MGSVLISLQLLWQDRHRETKAIFLSVRRVGEPDNDLLANKDLLHARGETTVDVKLLYNEIPCYLTIRGFQMCMCNCIKKMSV